MKFWNYALSLVFAGLPIWLLFMLDILTFKNKIIATLIGIVVITVATFVSPYAVRAFQKWRNTKIEPSPLLDLQTSVIFIALASLIWFTIVITNG